MQEFDTAHVKYQKAHETARDDTRQQHETALETLR